MVKEGKCNVERSARGYRHGQRQCRGNWLRASVTAARNVYIRGHGVRGPRQRSGEVGPGAADPTGVEDLALQTKCDDCVNERADRNTGDVEGLQDPLPRPHSAHCVQP